jgi:dynein heavy chain
VINAAGLLKQKDPDGNEQMLLLKALQDVNVPKFLKDDLPLFANIIKDLFPELEQQSIINQLEPMVHKSIELQGLYPHHLFIEKCIQFYSTTLVRHGIMLVG